MHKIIAFARREYLAAVKTKGFIIGLLLAPIMMGGSMIVFIVMKDRIDTTDRVVAVIDRSGVVGDALLEAAKQRNERQVYDSETGDKVKPAYTFSIVSPAADTVAQRVDLSERVRAEEFHAFIEVGADVLHPIGKGEGRRILYFVKNPALDEFRRWMGGPLNEHLRRERMKAAGLTPDQVPDLFWWMEVEGMGLLTKDAETGEVGQPERASPIDALVVPIVLMMLMFLMMMMSVPGMLQSVMEEKTQRIAEVLLSSMKPFEFMAGKVFGGIAVALTSSSVYIIGGVITVNVLGYERMIPYHVLPWFFVYMLLAVIMFGAMATALGSTCSEPKDAQSLSFPAILPAIIPMFVYFPVVREPASAFSTWLSIFPPFTPTLMVLRMATPEPIPLWQPLLALIGMLVFTYLFVWLGARIFRVAILIQGTPPKLTRIVRWAIKG
jgi:ABC-type Na+ efflux pump permease subunit